jgi:hypothetical protein
MELYISFQTQLASSAVEISESGDNLNLRILWSWHTGLTCFVEGWLESISLVPENRLVSDGPVSSWTTGVSAQRETDQTTYFGKFDK